MRSTSRRGFSGRSIFSVVLAVLLTVLLVTGFLASTPSNAQARGASWLGDSIIHDGRQYYAAEPATAGASHGLAEGTLYYLAVEVIEPTSNERRAHIIYFAPGSDPPNETSATYRSYDYSPSNEFSNPTPDITLTMTVQAESGGISSCSVDGIGWFICPVTVFLADAMDWVFEAIANFLAVQPLLVNDTESSLYVAWNVMRSFANVAFIIAFLIIIYSQLTSWGVSNYGLKKLLPRLIVAAILVNLSFYISALAVDLSNIAGYGLQNILIEIRQSTFGITNETFGEPTSQTQWANVTAAVLSGGAVTAGIVGLSGATAGAITSAVYLLVPLLVGLLLTLLFVLLILAARQAIIIILIVLAPLAFVANLLPNTEKWFDKWRGLFTTMLIFFPAFSIVFGGSQLAGGIIIQNSGGNIIMMIFGMAVQVAPLVITPLLLKLSGSLLGRIAGIINNPRKGLLDRSRNWAGDRAKMHRARSLQRPGGANPFRRIAQRSERSNRLVKDRTGLYESRFDNQYHDSEQYGAISRQKALVEMDKQIIEQHHKQDVQDRINMPNSTFQLRNAQVEAGKLAVERAVAMTAAQTEEFKYGTVPTGARPELQAAIARLSEDRQGLEIQSMRTNAAKGMQQSSLARALKASEELRQQAGGIDITNGAQRALANATAQLAKVREETLGNVKKIIEDENLTDSEIRELAKGNSHARIAATQDVRAAALQMTLGGANSMEISKALREVDFSFADVGNAADREELQVLAAEAFIASKARPPEITFGVIANLKKGLMPDGTPYTAPLGDAGLEQLVLNAANAGKLDVSKLSGAGKDYTNDILQTVRNRRAELKPEVRTQLVQDLMVALDPNREAYESLGDSRGPLRDILAELDPTATPPDLKK